MFGFGKSKKKNEPENAGGTDAAVAATKSRAGRSRPKAAGGIGEYAQQLMDMLGCPCKHFPKGTDPQKVLNAYDDAFAKREMGGYTPMIIAANVTLLENIEDYSSTAEQLKANRDKLLASERFDVRKWFTERLSDWKNELGETDWNETVGDIACENGDISKSFSGFMDFSKQRKSEECILALIPTNEPWEVFAWLPFGGWNECPMPEEMLWIAKYWYERFGAIPAVMTHDVVEFSAPPVKDKDTALGLALEQFAFCQDIVFQGVDTIGRLAGGLTQSSVWFFWWD